MVDVHKLVDSYKPIFESQGTIMIPVEDGLLSAEEFDELDDLAMSLPREYVETGDAGEPNNLEVARFITDVEGVEYVNRPSSDRAVEILGKPELMDFYQDLLGKSGLTIRRMQMNIMHEGAFVGFHLDTDSNPDYLVAVVIQLGDDFEGGEYVVSGGKSPPRSFSPTHRSLIVSDARFPHEVKPVKSGTRKSLVFFLSESSGANRRVPGTGIYERGK